MDQINQSLHRYYIHPIVEKDKDTFTSVIYSLADFGSEEVRNDHNYLINYFKGNYGALPFIDFPDCLIKIVARRKIKWDYKWQ